VLEKSETWTNRLSNKPPTFQPIFGDTWSHLPQVMHNHYANRPFTNDVVIVEGLMEVKIHWLVKLFGPLFTITKTLVPKAGKAVEVTVKFKREADSNVYCFDREFLFQDGSAYRFFSRMEPVGGNQVVEWTSSGIGWRAAYTFENDRVVLRHRGYCIQVFGKRISLPLTALFGHANAEEHAISDNEFAMTMSIRHPLFGELYSYSGTFEIAKMILDE
jgi:hypothetical protein